MTTDATPASVRSSDVVVVTGMSGAGRSTALRALADLSFYCIDNLPPVVVEETLRHCQSGGIVHVAFGLDVRAGAFLEATTAAIELLAQKPGVRLQVLFLEASDEALLRRYSSTRRPHPLGEHSSRPIAVLDGIQLERERLAPMRSLATDIVDTTHLTEHQLRERVLSIFASDTSARPRMLIRLLSFGFKYGLPLEADLVFDVRFIQNPFFVDHLRPLSGHDVAVKDYVFGHATAREFRRLTFELLSFLLPLYQAEGKSYLTVAIGCTGGRHRSVAMAAALGADLKAAATYRIETQHRDVQREGERLVEPLRLPLPTGSGSS